MLLDEPSEIFLQYGSHRIFTLKRETKQNEFAFSLPSPFSEFKIGFCVVLRVRELGDVENLEEEEAFI